MRIRMCENYDDEEYFDEPYDDSDYGMGYAFILTQDGKDLEAGDDWEGDIHPQINSGWNVGTVCEFMLKYPSKIPPQKLEYVKKAQQHYEQAENGYETSKISLDQFEEELSQYLKPLSQIFNEYYLCARVGDEFYDDCPQDECAYFRITSEYFDWYNVIWNYIVKHYKMAGIKEITIEKFNSKTKRYEIYKAKDGTQYNHMPVEEFISEEHGTNPRFESRKRR